ncbi:hypothetical protein [Fimbriiglobus ruber]|uniref:hypothetical protein n=1 Tax=Fimbriiglobus ruber TaxID=1908690 RepID=UPI00137A61F8|nr:hypothetical protein [Fimbriiglobus ruber]
MTSLTDAYGNALVYTTVAALIVQIVSASGNLVVGGGSNPLLGSDQYTIKGTANSSMLPISWPFTVSGTAKVITLTPSTSLTFNIIVIGS